MRPDQGFTLMQIQKCSASAEVHIFVPDNLSGFLPLLIEKHVAAEEEVKQDDLADPVPRSTEQGQ